MEAGAVDDVARPPGLNAAGGRHLAAVQPGRAAMSPCYRGVIVLPRDAAERGAVGQGEEVVLHGRASAAGEGALDRPLRPSRPPTLAPAGRHAVHLYCSFEGFLVMHP